MALLLKLTQKLAAGFQGFWDRWPRREAKKDAEKAWKQKVTTPETEELIHAALDWQIPLYEQRDRQFIPLAATYLRGERWTDEPPTTTPNRPTVKPLKAVQTPHMSQQEAMSRIQYLMREGMERSEAVRKVSIEMGWIKE